MQKTFDWFWTFLEPGMLTNSVGLIVETPNPQVHPAWCRDPNRAWTGDQGKFLCDCIETLKKEPPGSARAANLSFLIDSLVQGFVDRTNTLVGTDGVLREFDSDIVVSDDNNSNFNNNYCTGPGVLMRYLGECYSDLTAAQKTPFAALITTSAQAAWNNRASNYQIRAWYTNNLANTKYNKYYIKNSPPKTLWDFAFQTAALDLMVALRLY